MVSRVDVRSLRLWAYRYGLLGGILFVALLLYVVEHKCFQKRLRLASFDADITGRIQLELDGK